MRDAFMREDGPPLDFEDSDGERDFTEWIGGVVVEENSGNNAVGSSSSSSSPVLPLEAFEESEGQQHAYNPPGLRVVLCRRFLYGECGKQANRFGCHWGRHCQNEAAAGARPAPGRTRGPAH